MGHADGICHVFVDRAADLKMATQVVKDSKTNYPQACNAAETVLVHKAVASTVLPALAEAMPDTTFKACPEALSILGARGVAAAAGDFSTEWGDLTLGVKVVKDVEEAIEHIRQHGSRHTDVIVTSNPSVASTFTSAVDSAGVYVNASSRFADGFRYGFGAEVGVSTGKLHARGPVGLDGILSYKYQVLGNGHTVGGDRPTKLEHKELKGVNHAADIANTMPGMHAAKSPRELLRDARRILIKVGSNVVTRSQGGGVALGRLAGLVEQVAQLSQTGREVVLISSGGIAAGRRVLGDADAAKGAKKVESLPIPSTPLPLLYKSSPPQMSPEDQKAENNRQMSAAGQSKLMALYEQLFGVYDTHVAQLLISIPDLEYTHPRQATCRTIEGLMHRGIVPIVNENDAISYEAADGDGSIDKEEMPISDNDSIAAVLAVELKCDLVILLSEVDGVYEDMSNPVPIPVLTEQMIESGAIAFSEKSSSGRGGMESKVRAAQYMMRRGVKVVIANGSTPARSRTLLDVVKGEGIGTLMYSEAV
jgi:glutamate 5-kinase